MITASIVIYHNDINDINNILACVLSSCIDKLYLIDQSSNDRFRLFEKKSDRIVYVFNYNGGYGFGHNLALKMAGDVRSKYHIILNPDIIFEADAIDVLFHYMNSNEDVGLVMPKVFYPNGDFQYLCKLLPTPMNVFTRRFLPKKYMKKIDNEFILREANFDSIMDVPYLSGCFMFFRMSEIEKVGGFDERYFMHFEDVDISRRIYVSSRCVYLPTTSIVHVHIASHKTNFKMLYIAFLSCVKYFNKWGWFFDIERTVINKKVKSTVLK